MAGVVAQPAVGSAECEEVLECLASLVTQKVRADTGSRGNQWELMANRPSTTSAGGYRSWRLKVVPVQGRKGRFIGHSYESNQQRTEAPVRWIFDVVSSVQS
uniref:Uncharacterized protein n=1 Tax=Leersia perrieri TaxID=77586 RepID=A0A0D9X6H2_9ORYZ